MRIIVIISISSSSIKADSIDLLVFRSWLIPFLFTFLFLFLNKQ